MLTALLFIRYKQILRSLQGLGFLRSLVLLFLISGGLAYIFQFSSTTQNAFIILVLQCFGIGNLHFQRNDRQFLKLHTESIAFLFLSEYLILSLPFICCSIIHQHWIALTITLLYPVALSQLDFRLKRKTTNNVFSKWIPSESFEWKAWAKSNANYSMIIWGIALVCSFFIGAVPIALFFFGFLTINYYEKNEPLSFILVYEKSAKAFLAQKIRIQLSIFSIICLPLVAVFHLFHPEHWYIPVVELGLMVLIHCYLILLKYAFYRPQERIPAVSTFGVMGFISILFPLMLPIVLLMSIRFYFKAIRNLNTYLHDFS
ncbi:hypothetical protein [Sediminitomix flava]|uniref:Uncharacterized protein n=1 Tax=Sediminitomix flava TaxID=379075 RepID=A0A315YWH4_SEDFL|nr:hypothetical protein [Sediminitomix flava]PWJ34209.1 hypothetical protein BC781_111119 [Sediminitomix flava]